MASHKITTKIIRNWSNKKDLAQKSNQEEKTTSYQDYRDNTPFILKQNRLY